MTAAAPFGFSRVVFLSHVLSASTPVFPGDPPVTIHPAATIERDGFYLQSLAFGEQSGTHWAAPAHFHSGQAAADELDPGDFFHPAVVLDVRAEAAEDADLALGVGRVREWEAAFGPILPGSAVIMWTGFEDRWHDPPSYLNQDPAGRLHYPGFSAKAARWLVEHRSITALGTNQVLLFDHRLHLENLCGLSEMPPVGGWIIIGGIRVRAGSGSPATVFGLIP